MRGNCFLYAFGMWLAEGFTGRIVPGVLWGWPPKLRFYYRDRFGVLTRFAPLHPRRGWGACLHAFWFEGKVHRVSAFPLDKPLADL